MRRTAVVAIAMLALACGRQDRTNGSNGTSANGSQGQTATSGAPSDSSNEMVSVVGCLQGPSLPQTTGTSGTVARGTVGATNNGLAGGYKLVDANAATPGSAGTGENGAGGSGGPLVSSNSTLDLDGVPAPAQADVNKQVRVTGKLDHFPPVAGHSTSSTDTNGSPAGSAGSTPSSAYGVTQNDQAANASGAVHGTNQRLIVQTIQVVSENCAPK